MSTHGKENKTMIYQIYCQNRKKPTYPYLTGFHAQIEKANLQFRIIKEDYLKEKALKEVWLDKAKQ